jgi:hypothetical protein
MGGLVNAIATRLTLGVVGIGVAAVVMPAAEAHTMTGGCSLSAQQSPGNPMSYVGTLSVSSTTQEPNGLPAGAAVTCWVSVNDVEAPSTRINVDGQNGSQNGFHQVQFTAVANVDVVSVCKSVYYADGDSSDGGTSCVAAQWQLGGLAVTGQN